jgi:hypothetical protein
LANRTPRDRPSVAPAPYPAQRRSGTFEPIRYCEREACRQTSTIRGVACFIVLLRGSESLSEGPGLVARSMRFPAATTVEGVPPQLQAAAHMARIDARPTAAAGGDLATGATSAPRIRCDLSRDCESFSPRGPAPVAPPLPAQSAIRRDRSDESALSPRRSTPPANPAPRLSAYGRANRRRADRR